MRALGSTLLSGAAAWRVIERRAPVGISRATFYRLLAAGAIPHIRYATPRGYVRRVDPSAAIRFFERAGASEGG
jgi:hypothetical protein